jgi:hypothetical protein
MRVAVARAVMSLAACCLGENRRKWALAMQAELETAIDDGRPLQFAMGCLLAAWQEMPAHEQGRFVLANHALALGILIPIAVLQFECLAGLPFLSLGQGGLIAMLTPGSVYLAGAYHSAIAPVIALWLLLGIGHLRLAWLVLERDWPGVIRIGALTLAASATLVILAMVLFLDDAGIAAQALLLAIELTAIYALARWHDRAFPGAANYSR